MQTKHMAIRKIIIAKMDMKQAGIGQSTDLWHQSFSILSLCWLSKFASSPKIELWHCPFLFHNSILE